MMRAYFEDTHPLSGTEEQKKLAAEELLRQHKSLNGGRATGAAPKLLMTEDLIRVASDPANPLHDLFEWDDTEAARKYRKVQARQILAAFRIEVSQKKPPIRFVSTVRLVDDAKIRGYVPVDKGMAYQPDREFIMQQAKVGLIGWKERYSNLEGFEAVYAAIASVTSP